MHMKHHDYGSISACFQPLGQAENVVQKSNEAFSGLSKLEECKLDDLPTSSVNGLRFNQEMAGSVDPRSILLVPESLQKSVSFKSGCFMSMTFFADLSASEFWLAPKLQVCPSYQSVACQDPHQGLPCLRQGLQPLGSTTLQAPPLAPVAPPSAPVEVTGVQSNGPSSVGTAALLRLAFPKTLRCLDMQSS